MLDHAFESFEEASERETVDASSEMAHFEGHRGDDRLEFVSPDVWDAPRVSTSSQRRCRLSKAQGATAASEQSERQAA